MICLLSCIELIRRTCREVCGPVMGGSKFMSHNLDDGSDRESSHSVGKYDESLEIGVMSSFRIGV